MNTAHAANFMRSATAPLISAGVITANVSWKALKTTTGIVRAPKNWFVPRSPGSTEYRSLAPRNSKSPSQPASPELPKASVKPRMTQSTGMIPTQYRFIMSMLRTFFERVMPP